MVLSLHNYQTSALWLPNAGELSISAGYGVPGVPVSGISNVDNIGTRLPVVKVRMLATHPKPSSGSNSSTNSSKYILAKEVHNSFHSLRWPGTAGDFPPELVLQVSQECKACQTYHDGKPRSRLSTSLPSSGVSLGADVLFLPGRGCVLLVVELVSGSPRLQATAGTHCFRPGVHEE